MAELRLSSKCQKPNELSLQGLPMSLLGVVASFLLVREVMIFISRVCRDLSQIQVPWFCINMESLEKLSSGKFNLLYTAALRMGNMKQLHLFRAVLTQHSVTPIQNILDDAPNLTNLELLVHTDLKNLSRLKTTQHERKYSLSSLVINFDDQNDANNASLAEFMATCVNLSELVLTCYQTSWRECDTLDAASLFVHLRALRSVEISGVIIVDQKFLDSLVDMCSELSRIRIPLTTVKSPEVLCKLTQLEDCSFIVNNVDVLAFVKELPSIQKLCLSSIDESNNELVLPPSLRELACLSYHPELTVNVNFGAPDLSKPVLQVLDLPAANLKTCPFWLLPGLTSLSCRIEAEDVCFLLQLLAGGCMPRLKYLRLIFNPDNYICDEGMSRLLDFEIVCSSVGVLVLENFSDSEMGAGLTWLRIFPELVELTIEPGCDLGDCDDGRELQRLEAFKACPKLERLIDASRGVVVTVGRSCDGRLRQQYGEHVSELIV
jgi:hypothetical protein